LEKNITKKENTKETGKKPCEEKLYQSIVFCEEKLVIAILKQLNIKKIKLTNIILGENITKTEKNHVGKNTVAINSNFRGKLHCFPHIL